MTELRGLRTVIYPTDDLAASTAWWTSLLGFGPYFDEPFYVGFDVGGHELGLLPDAPVSEGALAYWRVDDVLVAVAAAVAQGAVLHTPAADVGGGIVTALVRAPDAALVGFISLPPEG